MNRLGPLAALVAIAAGCGTEDLRIVVKVETDMKIPGEVNRISFSYRASADEAAPWTPGKDLGLASDPKLRLGPGYVVQPVSFGLIARAAPDATVSVRISLWEQQNEIAHRDLVVPLWPPTPSPRTVSVRIDRVCAKARCPAATTCVPGHGCVPPAVDESGAPKTPPNGPGCDCNSYFPICVGARWMYDECPPGEACRPKTWIMGDHGAIDDMLFGLRDVKAFLQFRESSLERTRRWVEVRDDGSIWWRKDEFYDQVWRLQLTKYYTSAKLRFDPSQTVISETPWATLEYREINVRPDGSADPRIDHYDQWTVVSAEALPTSALRAHLAKLDKYRPLCHHRLDVGGGRADKKIFCFARGLGKVVEHGQDLVDEFLRAWDIPGCSKQESR